MNESEAVNELMEDWSGADRVEPESHYNYFGTRGVADLFVEIDNHAHLFELKGDAAINEVTGANEIVRQFNQMREYYFRDDTKKQRYTLVSFRLYFLPSETVLEHLRDNLTVYESLSGADKENVTGGVKKDITEVEIYDGQTSLPVIDKIVNNDSFFELLDEEYPVAEYMRLHG